MASCIVRKIDCSRVCRGGTVTMFGSFSLKMHVWLGSNEVPVVDYDDDFISFACNVVSGSYTIYVGEQMQGRISAGTIKVCVDESELAVNKTPRPSVFDITLSMLGLLPTGFAWCKRYQGLSTDSNFAKLMSGLAVVVDKVYEVISNCRMALSPSHTTAYDVWENELNLPEDGIVRTGDARRDEVFRKTCRHGGNTVTYLKSIAKLFGIDVDIYEYCKDPEQFSGVQDTSGNLKYYWMIRMKTGTPGDIPMRCGDIEECEGNARSGNRLITYVPPYFYSMIEKLKPAHTKCLYAYPVSEDD